ncbi:MAG: hypothetical protein DWQ07_21210 [Chloroflexi bacterium]|nr:MAG: hypothetical protein DWQ07_21210 [Chloroflexota bacterium]MBL1194603.1 hypothetical protein [Chloroflexota bacterium]NOH11893.1 hypothetical protein [Chloroflexota bacterium]
MTIEQTAFPRWLTVLSFVLVVPALYFVSANLFKYQLGVDLLYGPMAWLQSLPNGQGLFDAIFSPIVILGGIFVAAIINTFSVLRFAVRREEGEVISTVTLKTRAWNLVVLGLAVGLSAILFVYLLVENVISQL